MNVCVLGFDCQDKNGGGAGEDRTPVHNIVKYIFYKLSPFGHWGRWLQRPSTTRSLRRRVPFVARFVSLRSAGVSESVVSSPFRLRQAHAPRSRGRRGLRWLPQGKERTRWSLLLFVLIGLLKRPSDQPLLAYVFYSVVSKPLQPRC